MGCQESDAEVDLADPLASSPGQQSLGIGSKQMQEKASPTAKQLQLIAALAAGKSIVDAAKACEINESTAHRWLKLPAVQSALEDAKQQAFHEALSLLRAGTKAAITTLANSMKAESESVRLRAAQIWLEQAIALHGQTGARTLINGGIVIYLPEKETDDDSHQE